jgi:hypothetical protein
VDRLRELRERAGDLRPRAEREQENPERGREKDAAENGALHE